MVKKIVAKIKNTHMSLGQRIGAASICPSEKQVRGVLFVAGVSLLALGLSGEVVAQFGGGSLGTKYNDVRIANAVNAIMMYLEGTFGALIMAVAGVLAIFNAAFGNFKAAMSLMVVAVGAFILRSLMSTFFNDQGIMD